jgi:hypothetical protein
MILGRIKIIPDLVTHPSNASQQSDDGQHRPPGTIFASKVTIPR